MPQKPPRKDEKGKEKGEDPGEPGPHKGRAQYRQRKAPKPHPEQTLAQLIHALTADKQIVELLSHGANSDNNTISIMCLFYEAPWQKSSFCDKSLQFGNVTFCAAQFDLWYVIC